MSDKIEYPNTYMWVGILFIVLCVVAMLFAISFHMTTAIVFIVLAYIVHLLLKNGRLDRFAGWVADL